MTQQWKPIASAPKDELILVGPTKRMGICVAMNHSRDGWVTETCNEWFNIYTPTHWMSLPAAPGAVMKPQERVAYTDGMGHLHWVNGRKVGVSLYVAPIATVRETHEERPEFEAWLWGDKTERDPDDMNKPEIDAAWRAWQARANLEAGDKDE